LISDLEEIKEETFDIFPNPTQDLLQIEFSEEIPQEVQLYSIDGNLRKTQAINTNRTLLNVKDFPAGLYYVSLIFENRIESQRVVIEE